jgi:hypothetical protein
MAPEFTANRFISSVPSSAPATSPHTRRGLCPWPPHRHREPLRSQPTDSVRLCGATRPISARFESTTRLRSSPLVPFVYRLISLAPPDPPGGSRQSRHCQRCLPSSPASPGSDSAPLLPGCRDNQRGGLAPPSIPSASRRTATSCVARSARDRHRFGDQGQGTPGGISTRHARGLPGRQRFRGLETRPGGLPGRGRRGVAGPDPRRPV